MLSFGAIVHIEAQTPAPDISRFWTSVGSAGTVDEADVAKIFFDHAVAQSGRPLTSTTAAAAPGTVAVPPVSAVIRYNVTAVDGLFTPNTLRLRIRYLATGPSARVVAKFREVDIATGIETDRITFDSRLFAATNAYHVDEAPNCKGVGGPGFAGSGFDFINKAYYIEVTLTRSSLATGSAAGVQVIQLVTDPCVI
ncbi:MAG TPA: hypothetical protein VHY33_02090 [Thermoanaerobaculia bacterium]|nr:hypothetical protein [Thermoanaerobaculia bacterium]